jgi:dihydropteroate synthase
VTSGSCIAKTDILTIDCEKLRYLGIKCNGNSAFAWGKRTCIMGVLNVTPDSFSDGGDFISKDNAIAQAQSMIAAGVDIIDIGGQSTRPSAEQISLAEECDRVIPVLQAIRSITDVAISVDTTRTQVAKASIEAGADIINDISGGTFDPEILKVVALSGVPIILMHIRGTPQTMQKLTNYNDVIIEIKSFLAAQIDKAINAGINAEKIIIDPGIGFAKNYEQNLEIFRRLSELRQLNCPILVGASRKSFIGRILNQPDPKQRIWGTAAACCAAIFNGADIIRVHDVKEMREVSLVADAIIRSEGVGS